MLKSIIKNNHLCIGSVVQKLGDGYNSFFTNSYGNIGKFAVKLHGFIADINGSCIL
jgi:hypothetical protein